MKDYNTNKKNNINENKNANKENKLTLYKSIRILVYCLLLLSIIFINMSASIFPSSSIDIKEYLKINDYHFGQFFLYSSIGKIIGSILYFSIKRVINRKVLLILTTLINSIILIIFQFTNSFWVFCLIKGIMGITDMLIQIFVPVWIQQFGIAKYKLGLTSIIQLSNPFGKVLAFIGNNYFSWLTIYKILGIFFGIIFISFIIIPNQYTAKNILILIDNGTGEEMIDKRSEQNVTFYTVTEDDEDSNSKSSPLLDKNNNNNKAELESNLNINNLISQNGNKKIIHVTTNISFFSRLKMIFNNKIFMYALIIRTLLIGIQSTLSFWIPDIIIRLEDIQKKTSQNLFSNILIIITPPLGSFMSRVLGNFTIIGYKRKKKTTIFLILSYAISCICCLFIPNKKSFSFIATIIVFLFCSSASLPILQGICMSSINKKIKENIFSFIHIFTLFLGTGVLPYIFGFIYEKKEKDKIIGIKSFLYCSLGFGILLLPFLIYLIFRKEYNEKDRSSNSSINSKGFSIDFSKKNGGEGIMQELANAYGEDGEEISDIVKKKKKTQLKSIDI